MDLPLSIVVEDLEFLSMKTIKSIPYIVCIMLMGMGIYLFCSNIIISSNSYIERYDLMVLFYSVSFFGTGALVLSVLLNYSE